MCDFKVGDEVVCVDVRFKGGSHANQKHLSYLKVGKVYTVSEVNAFGIGLIGIPPLWADDIRSFLYYRADRFRKVQKRNSDLSIDAFLTIKPGFEEPRRVVTPKRVPA